MMLSRRSLPFAAAYARLAAAAAPAPAPVFSSPPLLLLHGPSRCYSHPAMIGRVSRPWAGGTRDQGASTGNRLVRYTVLSESRLPDWEQYEQKAK